MGCIKVGHSHRWPTTGTLTIQRCEIRCNFCTGEAAYKDWKYAWFLRRHVRAIHVKKGRYKGLRVDQGWNDENPRGEMPTRSSGVVKLEPQGSDVDVGAGVEQTNGDFEDQYPLPAFDPHYDFSRFQQGSHNNAGDYNMHGAEYGNLNAQMPTLAGELPYGMDHTRITEELQAFFDSTAGFDGNPEEDETSSTIDARMDEGSRQPEENPIPASSRGRFFMADVSEPEASFEDEDDMPLAHRMQTSSTQVPTDQMHHNMLNMLSGVSAQMQQHGMDRREMLGTVNLFMLALQQSNDNVQY